MIRKLHDPAMVSDMTLSAVAASSAYAIATHQFDNTPLNQFMTRGMKLALLTKQMGDLAIALMKSERDGDRYQDQCKDEIVKQLLQIAAGAAMWAESEDKRG